MLVEDFGRGHARAQPAENVPDRDAELRMQGLPPRLPGWVLIRLAVAGKALLFF